MSANIQTNERTRNWACVLYTESADDNFRYKIAEWHIPAFLSPLHDKDPKLNPDTGEILYDENCEIIFKKPHYHLQLIFDSVKTEKQARDLFETIGGVGCERINSFIGYARYLCHLNEDPVLKPLYNVRDVMAFGGADYMRTITMCYDKNATMNEMREWCSNNDIIAYEDLYNYAATCEPEWFDCLNNSGTYVMLEYIKSHTWKKFKLKNLEDIYNE